MALYSAEQNARCSDLMAKALAEFGSDELKWKLPENGKPGRQFMPWDHAWNRIGAMQDVFSEMGILDARPERDGTFCLSLPNDSSMEFELFAEQLDCDLIAHELYASISARAEECWQLWQDEKREAPDAIIWLLHLEAAYLWIAAAEGLMVDRLRDLGWL